MPMGEISGTDGDFHREDEMPPWIVLHAPNDEPLIVDIGECRVLRRPIPSEKEGRDANCTIVGSSRSLFVRETFEEVVVGLVNIIGADIYTLDGKVVVDGVEITKKHPKKTKG